MPRIPRITTPGYPYHVTQRGVNKMEVFVDDHDYKLFLRLLRQRASDLQIDIFAYCLMPNHFHLLAIPRDSSLSVFVHRLTFQYAQRFNRKYSRSGHLWQNRYFSCPIDGDHYLLNVIDYVEQNAVRAQLVKNAKDWPWSSTVDPIDGCLKRPCSSIGRSQSTQSDSELTTQNIRRATATGRPFGGWNFIAELQEATGRTLRPRPRGRPKKETRS